MSRALLLGTLVVAACGIGGGDAGPRYESSQDHLSFAKLDGWSVARDRATLLLRQPGNPAVIAVRSVPRAGWSEPRDAKNVFPAVETALRALPRARVKGPWVVTDTEYPGAAFDVEFTPPGSNRRRYHRLHVTLLSERYIIHVFETTPVGQLEASRGAFDTIVHTVREEG